MAGREGELVAVGVAMRGRVGDLVAEGVAMRSEDSLRSFS